MLQAAQSLSESRLLQTGKKIACAGKILDLRGITEGFDVGSHLLQLLRHCLDLLDLVFHHLDVLRQIHNLIGGILGDGGRVFHDDLCPRYGDCNAQRGN